MLLRALSVFVLATPAFADCPTAVDLPTGVKATLSDGSTEEYRTVRTGLVELIARYDDGYDARNLLGQGVYVIELADLEDGQIVPESRITSSYPMSADAMPLPQPGARWSVAVGMRNADGFFKEKQTHSWGEITQVSYQGCTYDMIPGEFLYTGDGYSYREDIHYLPELGVGLLVSYADGDDPPEIFTYDAFEIMADQR